MTSPPDVQNVPDIWGLLEQAHKCLWIVGPFVQPDAYQRVDILRGQLDAALTQRDRFVLVPKEPVALINLTMPDCIEWLKDPMSQNGPYLADWVPDGGLLYAAAPKPDRKS